MTEEDIIAAERMAIVEWLRRLADSTFFDGVNVYEEVADAIESGHHRP